MAVAFLGTALYRSRLIACIDKFAFSTGAGLYSPRAPCRVASAILNSSSLVLSVSLPTGARFFRWLLRSPRSKRFRFSTGLVGSTTEVMSGSLPPASGVGLESTVAPPPNNWCGTELHSHNVRNEAPPPSVAWRGLSFRRRFLLALLSPLRV